MNNKFIKLLMVSTIVMFSGLSQKAKGSLLQLLHEPLFLSQSVPPALAVTFDDSGSMAWGFMGPFFGYNTRQFADPSLNAVYYNPNIVYRPPIGADGVEFGQSDFNNAKIDGFDFRTNAPRVNLSANFIPIAEYYFYSQGDYSVRFARIPNTPGVDTVNTGTYNDTYPNALTRGAVGRAAFYYNGNTRVDVPASQQDNFANWYTYYSNRLKMGKTAVSRAFATFGNDFKISWQQLNNNTTFPALNKFELGHRAAFFNWLFAVPSNGGTPLRNAFFRAGTLFEDEDSYEAIDFNVDELSCQQNFHIALSDGEWNGGFGSTVNQDETSLTGGLPGDNLNLYDGVGGYTGTGEQQIYPLTEGGSSLSDIAFHFWSRDLMTGANFPNDVKRFKGDFTQADGSNITFVTADDWENEAFVWNPQNDPAYWQHMVTFNVGMGLEASLVVNYETAQIVNNDADPTNNITQICPTVGTLEAKDAVYQGLRKGDCDWPVANNAANKVDDVWHSSINSRGDFFSANDPQELTDSLNDVVNNILERLGQGNTSSISSGVVTSTTKAYTPGFDSAVWSGSLIARPVNADATFGTAEWDLSCKLTGGDCDQTGETETKQAVRNVYTYDKVTGTKVKFDASLSGNAFNLFETNSSDIRASTSTTVVDLIEYINGDQDQEIQNNGTLRNRNSVLADIVHSSPNIQRGPSANFDDRFWPVGSSEELAASGGNGYEDYQSANQNRTNMLYVGSNSGMLHAVNIDSSNPGEEGTERWAYMPSKALENIHEIVNPQFTHLSHVDNSGVIGDGFFNSAWHTVFISGMRYGGQAFFALDVTNTGSNEPDVMWEFTDEDDADMGFSYGHASIARIESTGDWVAFIPNGYNNSQKDFPSLPDSDSRNNIGDGSAVLYVVRLSDGQLLAKLDTNEGTAETPNGMAPAVAVVSKFKGIADNTNDSLNRRDEHGVDMAYAGDLYGNLWRFDLSSNSYSDWEDSSNIHRVVTAQGIKEQPITIQPRVLDFAPDPLNPNRTSTQQDRERDVLVYFATGKYIETPDKSINLPRAQYIVGLLDGPDRNGSIQIDSSNLITQVLENNTGGDIRNFSTTNEVDYSNPGIRGWKIELPQQGERVPNPINRVSNLFLLITSIIPSGENPCFEGGVSWLTAVNPYTGALPDVGKLFVGGVTGVKGTSVSLGGIILGQPPILTDQFGNANIVVEGGSSETTVFELEAFTWRRRGWNNLLTE